MDVLHGLVKQLGQVRAYDGCDGVILPPVLRALGGGVPSTMSKVVEEIAVDREPSGVADVYPLRQLCRGASRLWRKMMAGDDVRPGVGAKALFGRRMAPSSSPRSAR